MLETVTHARLRAAQGDRTTARRILQAILSRRPDDPEARRLLDRLEGLHDRRRTPVKDPAPVRPPEAAEAAAVAARLRDELRAGPLVAQTTSIRGRVARLRRWADGLAAASAPVLQPVEPACGATASDVSLPTRPVSAVPGRES